jgi:hypothetical protein
LFEDLNHAPPQFKKSAPFSRNVKRCRFCSSSRIRFLIESHYTSYQFPFFNSLIFVNLHLFLLIYFNLDLTELKYVLWFLNWSYISPWFFDYSFLSLTPNFNFLFSVKLLIDLLNWQFISNSYLNFRFFLPSTKLNQFKPFSWIRTLVMNHNFSNSNFACHT